MVPDPSYAAKTELSQVVHGSTLSGSNYSRKLPFQINCRCNTRGLSGKPLAGFCTTPSRRITVVYGVIVYAIRFKTPSLHR